MWQRHCAFLMEFPPLCQFQRESGICKKSHTSITFVLSKFNLRCKLGVANNAKLLQRQTLYVLLELKRVFFLQSFTVFVPVHIWSVCMCTSVCKLACNKFSPDTVYRHYTLLFPSLRASHQSELSTPPLHLSLATYYLAQQVA